jgi:hypothetical protein
MDPAEVDARARRPAEAGEGHAVERRRRHIAERAAANKEPMRMKDWQESGFRANVNRDQSSLHEDSAVKAVGARPNNVSEDQGGQQTHKFREWTDRDGRGMGNPHPGQPPEPPGAPPAGATGLREVETRPDGIRDNPDGSRTVVEHKHLSGDTATLNDSPQLRAQRAMAGENGSHQVVLSSDRPLGNDGKPPVRPSSTVGDKSDVSYYDPASGKVTHVWKDGQWE